jgi:hypothetical protein
MVDAGVLEVPPQPPIACYMILLSLPPAGGSGVEVRGLDPRTVPDVTIYQNGTVQTPTLRLVGTYDGQALTLTAPARPAPPRTQTPPSSPSAYATACPDPGGGPYTPIQRHAAIAYAQAQEDFGAVWFSEDKRVLNVSFAGDLGLHHEALRTVYPGPLCVMATAVTQAELTAIQRRLHADQDLSEHGIHILGSGQTFGKIHITVLAVGPDQKTLLRERYGPQVVVTSWLTPAEAE